MADKFPHDLSNNLRVHSQQLKVLGNWKPTKSDKNAFYFTLKALFSQDIWISVLTFGWCRKLVTLI